VVFANPRTYLCKAPGLKAQLTAPGYQEDASRKIWVESKQDIKKRTGQPSGNAADAVLQSLLVTVLSAEKPKEEEEPFHPPNFQAHFARWERRHESGDLIR
jgi:hypothetical protein